MWYTHLGAGLLGGRRPHLLGHWCCTTNKLGNKPRRAAWSHGKEAEKGQPEGHCGTNNISESVKKKMISRERCDETVTTAQNGRRKQQKGHVTCIMRSKECVHPWRQSRQFCHRGTGVAAPLLGEKKHTQTQWRTHSPMQTSWSRRQSQVGRLEQSP